MFQNKYLNTSNTQSLTYLYDVVFMFFSTGSRGLNNISVKPSEILVNPLNRLFGQIFYHIIDQVLGRIFDHIFDKIFVQVFYNIFDQILQIFFGGDGRTGGTNGTVSYQGVWVLLIPTEDCYKNSFSKSLTKICMLCTPLYGFWT